MVDTNIWLERLLNQEKSVDVKTFFDNVFTDQLFITDFTIHSIGVILLRLKKDDLLIKFIDDAFIAGDVRIIHLSPEDITHIVDVTKKYKLDFDDAYQYAAAKKYNLTIVSFDSDFDKTELGRKTPYDINLGK